MPARKSEALLALLALRPGVAQGREWLASLLWPDVSEGQARASLRQAVSHLRRALGEGVVISEGDRLHLEPGLVWVDAAELARGLSAPPLERAGLVELAQGELLQGFPALEEGFDGWLLEERARLGEALAARMEECVAALSATGRTAEALAVGSWLLGVDPTREDVHRAVISLYAAQGNRAAAARQLERCRSALQAHLGLAPSRETEALWAALSADASPLRGPSAGEGLADDGRLRVAVCPLEAAPKHDVAELSDRSVTSGVANRANLGNLGNLADLVALSLTEELRTELSRFRQLAVVVPEALVAAPSRAGPRLVLRGTVRAFDARLRVTASLLDTGTGLQLWAQTWEAERTDVLSVVDRITRSVVGALALRLDETRLEQARHTPRAQLDVYECWLHGMERLRLGTPQTDEEARGFFEEALRRAPRFARAYAGLSLAHFNDWSCQAWDQWELRERLARENAERAVALDDADHVPHYILARIHVYRRDYLQAERFIERALELNPNDADALMHAALVVTLLGGAERAARLCARAMELNPRQPDWYHAVTGAVALLDRRPADALRVMGQVPDVMVDTRAFLGAAAFYREEPEVARGHIASFLGQFRRRITYGRVPAPGEARRWLEHVNPFRRESDAAYLSAGVVGAGLGA